MLEAVLPTAARRSRLSLARPNSIYSSSERGPLYTPQEGRPLGDPERIFGHPSTGVSQGSGWDRQKTTSPASIPKL